MKKLSIIFFVFLSLQLSADDKLILMEEANKNYNEGKYHDAIELYQEVLGQGLESKALYYNLGNACFKTNDMASAILYYEKALKLDPSDEDTRFNLKIANNRIVDKIETVPRIFYVRWWKQITHSLSTDGWATASLVSFVAFLSLLLAFLFARAFWLKKISFWLGILMIILTVSTYSMANQRYNSFRKDHEAILFTPTVTIKSSPAENSIDLFVIHEGTKVEIIDHVGNWYEIKIANGSVGWLKADDIRKI